MPLDLRPSHRQCTFVVASGTASARQCKRRATRDWTTCPGHRSAGRCIEQARSAARPGALSPRVHATAARELGNEPGAPVMTTLDRLRAQSAALFVLELLARDEQAQGNGEQFACYAQAIMAVRKVTKDEPR